MNKADAIKLEEIAQTCLDTLADFAGEVIGGKDGRQVVTLALVASFDDGTHHSMLAGSLNRIQMGGILNDLILEIFHRCKQHEIDMQIQESVEKITLANTPVVGSKLN